MNKLVKKLLLIISLLSNIFFIHQLNFKTSNDESIIILNKKNKALKERIKLLKSNLIINLVSDSLQFKDLVIKEVGNKTFIPIHDIIFSKKLILYFPAMDCSICIENEIELFYNFFHDFSSDKVIIITTETNGSIITNVLRKLKINLKVFELKNNFNLLGNYSFYTVLDIDLQPRYTFFPNTEYKELVRFYFKFVGNLFKKEDI